MAGAVPWRQPAAPGLTLVATLTVRREAAAAFVAYEREAAAIVRRHGGTIARTVTIPAPEGAATLRGAPPSSPSSAAAFAAFRANPAMAAAATEREACIVATEVLLGTDGPDYRAGVNQGAAMKAYLITTGALFGLVAVARAHGRRVEAPLHAALVHPRGARVRPGRGGDRLLGVAAAAAPAALAAAGDHRGEVPPHEQRPVRDPAQHAEQARLAIGTGHAVGVGGDVDADHLGSGAAGPTPPRRRPTTPAPGARPRPEDNRDVGLRHAAGTGTSCRWAASTRTSRPSVAAIEKSTACCSHSGDHAAMGPAGDPQVRGRASAASTVDRPEELGARLHLAGDPDARPRSSPVAAASAGAPGTAFCPPAKPVGRGPWPRGAQGQRQPARAAASARAPTWEGPSRPRRPARRRASSSRRPRTDAEDAPDPRSRCPAPGARRPRWGSAPRRRRSPPARARAPGRRAGALVIARGAPRPREARAGNVSDEAFTSRPRVACPPPWREADAHPPHDNPGGQPPAVIKLYTTALGMTLLRQRDYPDGDFTLAFIGYGPEDTHPAECGLTYNYGVGPTNRRRLGHIAIGVPDIHAACDRIRTAGGRIAPTGPMKHGTTVIAFAVNPDGYRTSSSRSADRLLGAAAMSAG